jgi:hypothetical protein
MWLLQSAAKLHRPFPDENCEGAISASLANGRGVLMCAGDVCSATGQSWTNTWRGRGGCSWPVVTWRASMAETCFERQQPLDFVPCFWLVAWGRSGQGYRGMADIHIVC